MLEKSTKLIKAVQILCDLVVFLSTSFFIFFRYADFLSLKIQSKRINITKATTQKYAQFN